MSKHLFILGRNPILSAAEIYSYLEARKINFEVIAGENNMLLIEADINSGIIENLGGTIAIGKVLFEGNEAEIIKYIEGNEIYKKEEIKFNYAVIGESEEIKDIIKKKFKKERLKANLKNPELFPEKLKNLMSFFVFENHFGIIEKVYDTNEAEKRDMNKPVRRSELSISPRLARILVNLSQVKENETLLDCFCGIGTVMQEALLLGVNSIGIDKDKKAVENCRKNLEWLKKNYRIKSGWKILNADSRTARIEKIEGIACEPDLGETLKKSPKFDEAKETLRRFEDLMISVLNNSKKYLKNYGKIAFTSPSIWTQGKRARININKILNRTGLKLGEIGDISFPIREEREGKIVSREIYVLEK